MSWNVQFKCVEHVEAHRSPSLTVCKIGPVRIQMLVNVWCQHDRKVEATQRWFRRAYICSIGGFTKKLSSHPLFLVGLWREQIG